MPDDRDDDSVEITRETLETLPAIQEIGTLAVRALKDLGTVTFVVRPDGYIAYANPTRVHIEREAVPDPELLRRPYRLVRPVLSDGNARFVAWHGGKLWEIEFDDEPETEGG